ncbi:hypothetical protein PS9374_04654 [Planomonospora sphaerica]|uniref:Uncharacterized protein n=1 Tax=Planomonospora sphaerica TaxID=161355 RepID=A0A171DJI1_9ACTN|nr:hypothetical protein PS9374_04654 [Planomonospora sphaerica]
MYLLRHERPQVLEGPGRQAGLEQAVLVDRGRHRHRQWNVDHVGQALVDHRGAPAGDRLAVGRPRRQRPGLPPAAGQLHHHRHGPGDRGRGPATVGDALLQQHGRPHRRDLRRGLVDPLGHAPGAGGARGPGHRADHLPGRAAGAVRRQRRRQLPAAAGHVRHPRRNRERLAADGQILHLVPVRRAGPGHEDHRRPRPRPGPRLQRRRQTGEGERGRGPVTDVHLERRPRSERFQRPGRRQGHHLDLPLRR